MPAATAKGFPYPITSDPFLPATTDFPALAAAIESKTAREVAAVLSAAAILDVGVAGQVRAGRELVATDFTTLLGLGTPVGLWDAGSLTNLGSGGNLTNKGSVPLTAKGLAGTANHAALFAGSTGQALYVSDTGAADPFRLKAGSWGCWLRTAKRGANQFVVSKWSTAAGQRVFQLYVGSGNAAACSISLDGTASAADFSGLTDVADDRWHFAVATFDGSVVRLYVDGALDASVPVVGAMFAGSAPFNVGARGADGSTAAELPHYGRVAVPFVTKDVLNEDQIRLLMAAKVAHGYAVTPTRSHLAVRRKRKGGVLATGDFTSTPKRLYNLDSTVTAVTDLGSNAANLTGNGGPKDNPGPEGLLGTATYFEGTTTYYTATDTGLPGTTTARSFGAWFKTTSAAQQYVMDYGTAGNEAGMLLDTSGNLTATDGANLTTGKVVNDGQWHFGVVVMDNAAADGLKTKLYCDGRLIASATTLNSTTLAGANAFRVGVRVNGALFFTGTIARAFVTDYAMDEAEVANLYAKGSVALPASEKNQGDNVEAMDATNVYCLFDDLDSQHSVDLRVAA